MLIFGVLAKSPKPPNALNPGTYAHFAWTRLRVSFDDVPQDAAQDARLGSSRIWVAFSSRSTYKVKPKQAIRRRHQ